MIPGGPRLVADPGDLLPHAGAMRLITTVRAWDAESIACESTAHRDPGNPLRVGAILPIVCGLEFGAQAMAIHGALRAGRDVRPRVGLLVSVHELAWHRERLDDIEGPIEIEATCLLASANQVAYAFALRCAAHGPLLRGRGSVVLSAA